MEHSKNEILFSQHSQIKSHHFIHHFLGDDLAKVDTPDILNADEIREFWVTFEDDFVKVGRGGEHVPFMEAALPEHIEVAYFGYSTGWGAIGWWQFHRKFDNWSGNFFSL